MINNMKVAIVIGANGQDGSFLSELLVSRNYFVIGTDISHSSKLLQNNPLFKYVKLDLRNSSGLNNLLMRFRPEVVFHFAAVHGSAGSLYETIWQDMLLVNMGSVQVILEHLRLASPQTVFIYANSSKVFGPVYPLQISEQSPMQSSCLYTVTKIGAKDLIFYYRKKYGVHASNIFLFNHESERRPKGFFIPKITKILSKSLLDKTFRDSVFTLDFQCDWGSAKEFMDIAIDISEKAPGEDFVLGTGKTWDAYNFAKDLFAKKGLNYQNHISEKQARSKSDGIQNGSYKVILNKLEKLIGRKPTRSIIDVCDDILRYNYCI